MVCILYTSSGIEPNKRAKGRRMATVVNGLKLQQGLRKAGTGPAEFRAAIEAELDKNKRTIILWTCASQFILIAAWTAIILRYAGQA